MNDYSNLTRHFAFLYEDAGKDYTYPSVYFAYLFFALMFFLAVFFFIKSLRDGYWGKDSEEAKYRMFEADDSDRREP